jgi:hypothetical protein
MAFQRLHPLLRPRRPLLISTPPGFRRDRVKLRRRLLCKHARIADRRLSLHQRVLRLIAALANPEPYIARFLTHLRKGLRNFKFVTVAPPARACAGLATPDPCFVDDS